MYKLIVANWKMNGTLNKIKQDLEFYLNNEDTNQQDVIYAIPSIYLAYVGMLIESNKAEFKLASQDVSIYRGCGAYTGEVSGAMLADCKVSYSIVGHSERRCLLNESDALLVAKLNAVIEAGITPIYCIGESSKLRQSQQYLQHLELQLQILRQIKPINHLIIAYEPIWAIGTNLIPTMEQIQEVTSFIRNYFSDIKLSILYGGSVNSNNIDEILQINEVDGVLVGGASLKSDEFALICNKANRK